MGAPTGLYAQLLLHAIILLDFCGVGDDNGGRGTDSPGGRHPIRTNGASTATNPPVFYRPDALPTAQPTASKHWKQKTVWQYTVTLQQKGNQIELVISRSLWKKSRNFVKLTGKKLENGFLLPKCARTHLHWVWDTTMFTFDVWTCHTRTTSWHIPTWQQTLCAWPPHCNTGTGNTAMWTILLRPNFGLILRFKQWRYSSTFVLAKKNKVTWSLRPRGFLFHASCHFCAYCLRCMLTTLDYLFIDSAVAAYVAERLPTFWSERRGQPHDKRVTLRRQARNGGQKPFRWHETKTLCWYCARRALKGQFWFVNCICCLLTACR